MTAPTRTPDPLAALAVRARTSPAVYPAERFAGRGIVVCAGGARIFTSAFVLIHVLRKTLGCTLPIEVWHFGASEISPAMARLLAALDVTLVDAIPLLTATGTSLRDGWQLKPFAIRHSRFEEVLLLDADQVPVRDPAACFAWPAFVETGAVFWPDVIDIAADNPAWAVFGLPARRTASFESGQVLIDKRRHWNALSLVEAMNVAAESLYRMIYGDKDSFLLAWEVTGESYRLVPHRPFADERCLVQRDFDGEPLFQHRTNSKWSYAGEQHKVEGFIHLDACLAALDELRRDWGGRVFNPPDRSIDAREAEAALAAIGQFTLAAIDETIGLGLLPFGEIGEGRSSDRANWWCEDDVDGVWLVVTSGERVTLRLRRLNESDRWEGLRFRGPTHPISLIPKTTIVSPPALAGLTDQLLAASGYPHLAAADAGALQSALRLLARVEPGIRDRLQQLAEADPVGLGPLVAALDATPAEGPSVRHVSPMRQYYRPYLDGGT